MNRRNVRLTDEAYQGLVRSRRAGETFSDTIIRLSRGQDLRRYVGSISEGFAEELRASSREVRDRLDRDMRRRRRRHGFTAHDDR